jgi:branched-subunit amino acid aminotransferase/4-amino-4-deoxychorismate lyase
MYLSFNYTFIPEEEFRLPYTDRGFQYGDRLFETMIMRKGRITFLEDHISRLKNGMKHLGYQQYKNISGEVIETIAKKLAEKNFLSELARIKLIVWRKEGGKYTPHDNGFNILIATEPHITPVKKEWKKVGFAETVKLFHTPISRYKCHSLPYVLAGVEKNERQLEELILLDYYENIAECIASNIFWVKQGIFYTPKLNSGCIAGILRKNLLEFLEKKDIPCQKVMVGKVDLLLAENIFTCNVTGIYHILSIDNQEFEKSTWVDELVEEMMII